MGSKKNPVTDFETSAHQAISLEPQNQQAELSEFMCTCLKTDVRTAYQNLAEKNRAKGMAESLTLKQADAFLNKVYLHFETYLKQELDIKKYEFTKSHERLITDFCTELVTTRNFDTAFRNANEKLRTDPVLAGDAKFIEQFTKLAEKVKPKKENYNDLEITGSDGMFFMIRVGQAHFLDIPKTDQVIEQIVTEGLLEVHNSHLPAEEHVTEKEVQLDVHSILMDHQPSLATRLAQDDTRKIARMAHDSAKKAHEIMREITREFKEHPGIYNISKEELTNKHRAKLMEFRDAPRLSKTEKVDIVRELIINLSAIESPADHHKTYFPDSVKQQQKMDAFEKAEKRLASIESFAFELQEPADHNKLKYQLQQHVKEAKESILKEGNSKEKFEDLLFKTYKSVMRWDEQTGVDMKHEKRNIALEVGGLTSGIRPASVKEALYEINERRLLYIRSNVYSNYLTEAKKNGKRQNIDKAVQTSNETNLSHEFEHRAGKPNPSFGIN